MGFLSNEKHCDLAVKAGIHENSVNRYMQHLRTLVANWAEDNEKPIGGPGIHVELDETSTASQTFMKSGKAHLRYFRWIGAIQRGTNQLVLAPLPVIDQLFVDKPGKRPTMSGGVAYYQKAALPRPPPPPPLSKAEARPFLKKFLTPGTAARPLLAFADSAPTYGALINPTNKGTPLFGNRAHCFKVSHGKEEWTRIDVCEASGRPVKCGTQMIDGAWAHLKKFLAPHHGIPNTAEQQRLWVRQWQWSHSISGKNALRVFGDEWRCRDASK